MKELGSVDDNYGALKQLHSCEDAYRDCSDFIKDVIDAVLHYQYTNAALLLQLLQS